LGVLATNFSYGLHAQVLSTGLHPSENFNGEPLPAAKQKLSGKPIAGLWFVGKFLNRSIWFKLGNPFVWMVNLKRLKYGVPPIF
jgi:hypothetical protein